MKNKLNGKVASFMESYETLVALSTKDNLTLSLDDIYYIEYCKVKAELLRDEIKRGKLVGRPVKNELSLSGQTLEVIIEQIGIIEQIANTNKLSSKNKIDNKLPEYEYSVRKRGNKVYSEAFLTQKRDIVKTYSISGYALFASYIGLGIYWSDWSSTLSVAETFGGLAAGHLVIMGVAAKAVDNYWGKFNFKKYHVGKQKFISNILLKILTEIDKPEYMYLTSTVAKKEAKQSEVFSFYYALAKIEALGEFVNEHRSYLTVTDEDMNEYKNEHTSFMISKFEYNQHLEKQLRDIHKLLNN